MIRTVSLLLCCMLSLLTRGQVENDKVLHFAGGALFGTAGAGLGREITGGKPMSGLVGALLLSTAVGAGKEAIDAGSENGDWDNRDLLFTSLGGLAAGIAVELLTKRKPKWRYAADRRSWRPVQMYGANLKVGAYDEGSAPMYLENIHWVEGVR